MKKKLKEAGSRHVIQSLAGWKIFNFPVGLDAQWTTFRVFGWYVRLLMFTYGLCFYHWFRVMNGRQ